MDQWQKAHLTTNRGRLVDEIICNEKIFSHLLSEGVLAKVDVERIKRTTDRYEQAVVLLDIVETRTNGFAGMARALAKVNQTGPLQVFMDGFAQHVIPNIKVDFLGNTLALANLFDATEMARIIDGIKTHVTLGLKQYVNMYDKSKNTEPIKLLSNKIPEKDPFYVTRSLSRRLKVNPEVFKVDCPDVYAFKGIEWTKLAELVKPQRVAFSTTQLLSLSRRFIILEHEEDWEEICKTAVVPVHLIKCEEEEQGYVLEATTGGSPVLHHYLEHHHNFQSKDATISEEEFFEEVSRDGSLGVCICDLPGMGKSLLLANLATRMKQQNPDRLVVFVQMSHFTGFAVARKGEQSAMASDVNFAKETLLHYLTTPSHLQYFLLTELISKTTAQLELFFDGFDEVQMEQIQIAKQMLTLLSELPNTRIFVTSRPNMRHEMEASLHVVSYDILPFSHANQIDFLTAFWRQFKLTNSQEKLREFAEFCVGELREKLQENEREITGIPLQCRLVAEVFSREASIFAQPQRNVGVEELCKFESSIPDLYKMYCDVRFSKIVLRVNHVDATQTFSCAIEKVRIMMEAVIGANGCHSDVEEMKKFHMLQALKLLFPQYDELFIKLFEENATACQLSSVLSVGILQQQFTEDRQSLQFVHRTFAEYFAAEFFAELLASEMGKTSVHGELIRLFWQEVMRIEEDFYSSRFAHSVIVYFFNSACAKMKSTSNDKPLLKAFVSSMIGDLIYFLLYAIISENHVSILLLVKKMLSKVDRVTLKSYKRSLFPDESIKKVSSLMIVAAKNSSVFLVEQLFHLFRECFQIDLSGRDKQFLGRCYFSISRKESPLGAAVIRAVKERVPNYEMIQLFAECAPTKTCHLQECISKSQDKTPLEIEKLLSILSWLLEKYKNLAPQELGLLVNSFSVHLAVIKLLLRKGVDPREADKGRTLVHRASYYMRDKDFAELCQLLIHEFNAADLFDNVPGRWTSPFHTILAKETFTIQTIQMIYDVPWLYTSHETGNTFDASTRPNHQRIQVDINCLDENGWTPLTCAVRGERGTNTIARMIDNRANVLSQDKDVNTFVHHIGKGYTELLNNSPTEYHEFVKLLIDKQLGRIFEVSNNLGKTPLHETVRCIELLPETLNLLVGHSHSQNIEQPIDNTHNCYVNLNALDKDGRSILYEAVRGNRSLALIMHLIGNGANWSIKTIHNQNLAHACASAGLLAHLKFFVELGCDINEVDTDGNNVLQCAVLTFYHKSRLEIVQFLVANGAQKENKNKMGETAYMIAVWKRVNDSKFLELLK